jgi:hypothetical protein
MVSLRKLGRYFLPAVLGVAAVALAGPLSESKDVGPVPQPTTFLTVPKPSDPNMPAVETRVDANESLHRRQDKIGDHLDWHTEDVRSLERFRCGDKFSCTGAQYYYADIKYDCYWEWHPSKPDLIGPRSHRDFCRYQGENRPAHVPLNRESTDKS